MRDVPGRGRYLKGLLAPIFPPSLPCLSLADKHPLGPGSFQGPLQNSTHTPCLHTKVLRLGRAVCLGEFCCHPAVSLKLGGSWCSSNPACDHGQQERQKKPGPPFPCPASWQSGGFSPYQTHLSLWAMEEQKPGASDTGSASLLTLDFALGYVTRPLVSSR